MKDGHRAKSYDEWNQFEHADEGPVDRSRETSGEQCGDDPNRYGEAVAEAPGGGGGGERHRGTGREVDSPGDNDEGHSQRGDPHLGGVAQHLLKTAFGIESGRFLEPGTAQVISAGECAPDEDQRQERGQHREGRVPEVIEPHHPFIQLQFDFVRGVGGGSC